MAEETKKIKEEQECVGLNLDELEQVSGGFRTASFATVREEAANSTPVTVNGAASALNGAASALSAVSASSRLVNGSVESVNGAVDLTLTGSELANNLGVKR